MRFGFRWSDGALGTIAVGIFLLSLLNSCSPVSAAESFDDWVKDRQERFENYKTEREQAFQQFLKERWKQMRVFAGRRGDTVPKPDVFPTAPEVDTMPSRQLKTGGVAVPKSESEKRGEPEKKSTASDLMPPDKSSSDKSPVQEDKADFSIDFFGQSITVPQAKPLEKLRLETVSPAAITNFWSGFSKQPTNPLIDRLQSIKEERNLDGWGYLKLVETTTSTLYEDDLTARAVTWGLLLKSGYDVRLGYEGQDLFLLVRTDSTLYDIPYFELDGNRFFVYTNREESVQPESLRTYKKNFPGELSPLDIKLQSIPDLPLERHDVSLQFQYAKQTYQFDVTINEPLVQYLKTIPQLSLEKYFRAIRGMNTSRDLIRELEKHLSGLSPGEQLEFLLRFVQTAFDYKTDQDQFGSENFLLPVETLYYEYSDCEDRALLFTYLVTRLLDRRVVGLDYPGHVATAVRSQKPLNGFYFLFENAPYLVSDPTYVRARPGMIMPEYKTTNPKVIPTWDYR
ncbi:MAG: hypothetical protein ABEK50_15365 [bacterium]